MELDDGATDASRSWTAALRAALLKPDVVFFGENVPPGRVADCFALVGAARVLLVLGSSLTVMSGLAVRPARGQAGIPVAIVNQGPTRGDALATLIWTPRWARRSPPLPAGAGNRLKGPARGRK